MAMTSSALNERYAYHEIRTDEKPVAFVRSDEARHTDDTSHVPEQLLGRFVEATTRRAMTEEMEDGRWFARIGPLPGVWAEGATEDEALAALPAVVDSWVRFKIEQRHRDIPQIAEIDLNRL